MLFGEAKLLPLSAIVREDGNFHLVCDMIEKEIVFH